MVAVDERVVDDSLRKHVFEAVFEGARDEIDVRESKRTTQSPSYLDPAGRRLERRQSSLADERQCRRLVGRRDPYVRPEFDAAVGLMSAHQKMQQRRRLSRLADATRRSDRDPDVMGNVEISRLGCQRLLSTQELTALGFDPIDPLP